MDQIERSLTDIADRLRTAWQNNQCLTCPLGELAALAAATLTFYREQHNREQHKLAHWSNCRKK